MEEAHHYAWLSPTLDLLDRLEAAGRAPAPGDIPQLRAGLAECDAVLAQNPVSDLGKTTIDRIHRLLGTKLMPDSELQQVEEFEALLGRIDAGFAAMHQRLLGLPETLSPGLNRERQYLPFLVGETNRLGNKNRNTLRTRYHAKRGGPGAVPMSNGLFMYDPLLEENTAAVMAYDPPHRRLQLPLDVDPDSEFDMLALYHEHLHVRQDDELRVTVPRPQYADIMKPGNVIIDWEYEAYAYMFEQMNRIAGGRLRALKADWPTDAQLRELIGLLRIPPRMQAKARNLLLLAGYYFAGRPTAEAPFPPRFQDLIDTSSTRRGQIILRYA